jgi:hypothetical protein
MPSLHSITFPVLIQNIPVFDHSIPVDALFWQPQFADQNLWRTIFSNRPNIRLTRDRLLHHRYATQVQKCAEILLWGYPSNQRGIPARLLENLPALVTAATAMCNWPDYYDGFGDGIGISTITKFAYFYSRQFDTLPALILDSRLIDNASRWTETLIPHLNYPSARNHYIAYLQTMANASAHLGCTPDQLEMFLFALGDSFV